MISLQDSVSRWLPAYREYLRASEAMDAWRHDAGAARAVASASWGVAAAWRELAGAAGLPWWVLAAVDTSAEAFEEQARQWQVHANYLDGRHTGSGPEAGA